MEFCPRNIIRLLSACILSLLALGTLTSSDPSPGISIGGLSLSFGAGEKKGWEPPTHGWAPAPAKSWAPAHKPEPTFSISLPKPNIGQLLAIPLKVLKWKLNALTNQQISFRFTLPRISVGKTQAPAPWKPAPQPWASAPPPQPWAPAPWKPEPQPWKPEAQEWKPESQGWKAQPEPETWKTSAPKGWEPPAGWQPPQGWQQGNTVKWNK